MTSNTQQVKTALQKKLLRTGPNIVGQAARIRIWLNLIITSKNNFRKPCDPRDGNLTGELLWSDPVNRPGVAVSSRGIGVFFGPDVTRRFLG